MSAQECQECARLREEATDYRERMEVAQNVCDRLYAHSDGLARELGDEIGRTVKAEQEAAALRAERDRLRESEALARLAGKYLEERLTLADAMAHAFRDYSRTAFRAERVGMAAYDALAAAVDAYLRAVAPMPTREEHARTPVGTDELARRLADAWLESD